jgi:hypothetical protein
MTNGSEYLTIHAYAWYKEPAIQEIAAFAKA